MGILMVTIINGRNRCGNNVRSNDVAYNFISCLYGDMQNYLLLS